MRIDEYIENLKQRFIEADLAYGHGTDNPLDEAVYLVFSSLGIEFGSPEPKWQRGLTDAEFALLEERAAQRIEKRTPVAYLVGEAWFAGHRFFADASALVPRSPIAELIRQRFEPLLRKSPLHILDLCSGGGCIGIACALEFVDAEVDLADISGAALILAERNIHLHHLQGRVRTRHSDLFSAISECYDLIVCNPPYVSTEELATLAPEFHQEPVLGLHSEDKGLAVPLAILANAARHLNPDGVLIMEVGNSQQELTERLPQIPFLWLEFEFGGDGVFLLSREQLQKCRESTV